MHLRLPQVRDFDKLRRLLELVSAGERETRVIGEKMGAGPAHASRHATYYRNAADILGLLDLRRWVLTARGKGLLATEPDSEEERELLRQVIAAATALGELREALLATVEPDLDALVDYALTAVEKGSRATVERRVKDTLSWRRRLGLTVAPTPRVHLVSADAQSDTGQLDLINRAPSISPEQWPATARLPYNWPRDRIRVENQIYADLHESDQVLIVAGYASLEHLCDFVASLELDRPARVRVVFGTEPFLGRALPARSSNETVSQEVRDYWLEQGISILHAPGVLTTLDAIHDGRVAVRISRRAQGQHAKMFIGDHAVTIGSSNFTYPGLRTQLEANVRLTEAPATAPHFDDAKRLGEIYWKLAKPYDDELLALLRELLRKVTWREALARACAELLEGDWARVHLEDELGYSERLWPSQVQGLAQALYVLMEVGSVLVADATGSGKTKAGAWLLRALRERLVTIGRPISDPVLVTPPQVCETWLGELHEASVRVEAHSHGALSNSRASGHERVVADVASARILALDEAHNFIRQSNRTDVVNTNLADHVLLFTATPINRGVSDLLGIAELLGADNLDEDTLQILEEVGWRRRRELSEQDMTRLRQALRRFTVRRTKRKFNELIDREPGRYLNRHGVPCRFPEHHAHYYALDESDADCEIATEITQLARSLRGVLMFEQPVMLSQRMRALGWTPRRYVTMRVRSAKALVRYQVRSALRSSRAALWEHIYGTIAAAEAYELGQLDKGASGNVIKKIRALQRRGPPRSDLGDVLPQWLRDHDSFVRACAEDLRKYEKIGALCERLSDGREQVKVAQLRKLLLTHDLVIAFDKRPITLALMRELLNGGEFDVFLATGSRRGDQKKVMRAFGLGAKTASAVALCSNSMAEGINLQQASAVIHLDMPSVVRIAEQRVGRIDRMDSPHGAVESWWPRDAAPFALSSDEKLGARLELVGDLLGANIELPTLDEHPVEPEHIVSELAELEQRELELLDDAFAPVRALVDGPSALVDAATYRALRRSEARVLSSVAVVSAPRSWGFFAIPGGQRSAPRWVFVDADSSELITALDEIAPRLRNVLPGAEDRELDREAVAIIERLLAQLQAHAPALLPRRKQRALQQMIQVLTSYAKHAKRDNDGERLRVIQQLLAMTKSGDRVDFDQLAESWLVLVRPRWRAALREHKRRRSLRRLSGLRKDLIANPVPTKQLDQLSRGIKLAKPLAERVVAAIIGVPGRADPQAV